MSARARFKQQDTFVRANLRRPLCRGKVHHYDAARAVTCEALGLHYRAVDAPKDINQLRACIAELPDANDRGIRTYVPKSFEVLQIGAVA